MISTTATTKVFRAYHLTEGLKLTSILPLFSEKPFRASGTELVYRLEEDRFFIIYNFGSVVFFDMEAQREESVLATLRGFVSPKDNIVTSEEFLLDRGEKQEVDFRNVIVKKISPENISIIALVLAQSTALDYFETVVDKTLQQSGTISESLELKGKMNRREKDLAKFIGFCLNTKQKVIGSTYLLDSPEPTWESPTLENLHRSMVDMFELRERYRVLEYKLRMVQDTLEVLVDLSQSRRREVVDVSILVLILVEVIIFIIDIMHR